MFCAVTRYWLHTRIIVQSPFRQAWGCFHFCSALETGAGREWSCFHWKFMLANFPGFLPFSHSQTAWCHILSCSLPTCNRLINIWAIFFFFNLRSIYYQANSRRTRGGAQPGHPPIIAMDGNLLKNEECPGMRQWTCVCVHMVGSSRRISPTLEIHRKCLFHEYFILHNTLNTLW